MIVVSTLAGRIHPEHKGMPPAIKASARIDPPPESSGPTTVDVAIRMASRMVADSRGLSR